MNYKSMLLVGILFLLVVSVVVMAFITYTVAGSVKYEWLPVAPGGAAGVEPTVVNKRGTDGTKIWDDNKYYFMAPTVMNVIGVVMLGMLLYRN